MKTWVVSLVSTAPPGLLRGRYNTGAKVADPPDSSNPVVSSSSSTKQEQKADSVMTERVRPAPLRPVSRAAWDGDMDDARCKLRGGTEAGIETPGLHACGL